MKLAFSYYLCKEGRWWWAMSPDIPGCHGWAKSRKNALRDLRDAIESVLEYRQEMGLKPPRRSVPFQVGKLSVAFGEG